MPPAGSAFECPMHVGSCAFRPCYFSCCVHLTASHQCVLLEQKCWAPPSSAQQPAPDEACAHQDRTTGPAGLVHAVTFGQPRVGDTTFAAAMRTQLGVPGPLPCPAELGPPAMAPCAPVSAPEAPVAGQGADLPATRCVRACMPSAAPAPVDDEGMGEQGGDLRLVLSWTWRVEKKGVDGVGWPRYVRVVNDNDIVPRVPVCFVDDCAAFEHADGPGVVRLSVSATSNNRDMWHAPLIYACRDVLTVSCW